MEVLIVGHGNFAKGMQSSLEIIIGKQKKVTYLSSYVDNLNIDELLKDYFSNQQEVIVLTDLFGGSVNQKIMPYLSEKVHVITGTNLPLCLDVILKVVNENFSFKEIPEIIKNTQEQVIDVNEKINNFQEDDFSEF